MPNKKKLPLIIALLIIAVCLITAKSFYNKIYKSNVISDVNIKIPTNSDFEEVVNSIKSNLHRTKSFEWVAKKKKYTHRIKPGSYQIKKGMNNNELVNLLRSGNQTPVKVSFNNQDSLDKLAGRIAQQIEPDSLEILQIIKEEAFWVENGFSKATALSMYLPNSYQFYWNTSGSAFRDRMLKEYKKFWNKKRLVKAKNLNLTPLEVCTLASIVQKETSNVPERKTVAGLYLNRLKNKWPLQADPTIIFALKQKHGQEKEVKRVLLDDLKIDSPYNTYTKQGLPPGPIAMPDISSIEAVLNPAKHDYYFMCASVTDIGKHVFAKTLSQHNVNARKYQNWVAKQGY